jgi:enoyl-CoA hydratase/carnithine racemase
MTDSRKSPDSSITLEHVESEIALVTMSRPEKLNAIDLDMIDGFERVFAELTDDRKTRVVILTGAGRGFCSGADLEQVGDNAAKGLFTSPYQFLIHAQERYANLIPGLRRIPQPVIAAVNGPAAGGGFALAMGSDIRIAAPEAYFIASFVNIGLSAGEMGSSYLLPRLVGLSRASEILFTGRKVPAAEAEAIGLVSRVTPKDKLIDDALSTAKVMLGKSAGGLELTKRVLDANINAPSLENALDLENRNQTLLVNSPDFIKSVGKFGG